MSDFTMTIQLSLQAARHLTGFPTSVKMPMTREKRALKNHGQTLERLNERGGVSPCEAIALMRDTEWEIQTSIEIVDAFREFGWLDSKS